MSGLKQFVAQTVASNHSLWAWENYKAVVLSLQREYACESLLEVGGGRTPLIDERENDSLGVKYTLNDISACELGSAPEWVSKACFDICSPPTDVHSKFDLIFSKMVFEHISDAKKAYMGIYRLLVPGGLFLSFFPTLYCLPFFVNFLSPVFVLEAAEEARSTRYSEISGLLQVVPFHRIFAAKTGRNWI